ncbi:hypothetical protein [Actinocorallia aurea]
MFTAIVTGDGETYIRDPRDLMQTATWHAFSEMPTYPDNVVDVTLSSRVRDLLEVTVLTENGGVWLTACRINPEPEPPDEWPDNCTAFQSISPPNG